MKGFGKFDMGMKGKGGGWDDPWAMKGGKGFGGWGGGGGFGFKGWGGGADKGWGGGKGKGWGGAPVSQGWGGYGKGAAAAASAGPSPPILTLAVDASSSLPAEGYPAECIAMEFDKAMPVFGSAAHIFGELGAEVEIVDDPDWEKFPEIGAAAKTATGEDHSFAVGKVASLGIWAVGLGAGWKARERAIKLAVSLALLQNDPAQLARLAQTYPELGATCAAAGWIEGPAGAGKGGGAQASGGGGGAKRKADEAWAAEPVAGETPPVFWVDMPAGSSISNQGLPGNGLIVISGGSAFKSWFSNAASIYNDVCPADDITIVDDPEWATYGDIAEVVKATPGGEENCISVAYSSTHGVWAAGFASGKKPRDTAVKMAISLALAPYSEAFPVACNNFPELVKLAEQAGIPLPEGVTAKRAKGGW